MSALWPLSGAKRTSAGGSGCAHDAQPRRKTRPGRTTPIVASRGCCPGLGRTLRVVAPFVARLRLLLPHAATRRHAASPMTLVDAHRAARRDSPVLPVRIFPVGLSRPNPGREALFGRRDGDPLVVSGRGHPLTAGQIPGAPPVGSSDGVPISAGPRHGPQPPPVAAPYTDRAGFVEAGDRAVALSLTKG